MHMINFELLILLKFHIWGHTNNIGLIQSYQIYKVQTVVKIASVVFFHGQYVVYGTQFSLCIPNTYGNQ